VQVALHDVTAGTTHHAAFDAQGRPLDGAAATADGASDGVADGVADVARVPFGCERARGTLRVLAAGDGAPWSDADRALAEAFARLATDALTDDEAARHRTRLAELTQHVAEIQAIAALGSFQWFVAEDRVVWSDEQLRIHGLDAASRPRSLADFFACIHPDDQPAMRVALDQLLAAGHGEWHYRIVRPDGEVRMVHARNSVVRDREGRPLRVVGTVQDVTRMAAAERELRTANEQLEQRVAERTAELQRSEEHFRRLIEHAHDMIVIIDDEGRPVYGSPSVKRVLGFDPSEVDGTGVEAPYHPDDLPAIGAWVRGLREQPGTTQRLEYRIRHRDGQWLYLEAVSSVPADYRPGTGHVLNIRDVTERRRAEEELRRSEEHFRTLTENSHDIIVIIDGHTGHIAYQTPSMQRILGYAPEDMAGRNAFAFVHPDDLERVIGEIASAVAQPGTTRHAEYRYLHKDGSWRHLETFGRTLSPTTAEHGLVFNTRDVTERREAEEALRAEETRYRTLIDQLPAIIYTASVDEGNPTLFTSPHSERLLGFSEAEWRATPTLWLDRIHEEDRARVEADWNAAHAEGRRFAAEYRMVTRDGRVLWFRDEAVLLRDAEGRALYIQGVMLDVTERREAERALEKSNERWRAMIENAHDIVTILDPQGRMGYQSPALTRVVGYTPEELEGEVAFEYMHPDDVPRVVSQLGGVLTSPGSVGRAEYRFRHKDGSWRYLEAFGRTLSPHSAAEGIVANVRDITDRKEAERALQESEAKYRALIEGAHDMVTVIDAEGVIQFQSPAALRILGYEPEAMVGTSVFTYVHPDDVRQGVERFGRIIANPGTTECVQYRFRHADGTWRHLESFGRTVLPDSASAGVVGIVRDVTDRREAEEALQRSEEHFRRLIENSSDLLMISGTDMRLTYISPSAERLFGYAPAEMLAKQPEEMLHPDDVPMVLEAMQDIIEHPGSQRRATWRIRHKDGSWRIIDAIGRTVDPHSAALGVVCNGRDVTEQRETELALQRSEEHFRRLIENGSDLLIISEVGGTLTYVSPSVERLLGYRPEELLGAMPQNAVHPDDVPAVMETLRAAGDDPGTVCHVDFRMRHKNGAWRRFESLARTLAPDSAALGIVCNGRDVTEQRAAEEALQRSEEHFRRLIENGSDLLMISAPDGSLSYVSPSAERLLGLPASELIGRTPADLVHPDDVYLVQVIVQALAREPGTVREVEFRIQHADGSWRMIQTIGRTLANDSAAEGIVINGRDVTERRRQEAALRQAKAEAEQAREEAERANHAKSEFLSRMSHELRTPLNSILGFAQVLEDLELPPEYRGGVRHILNGGRHLLNLINEVLDIARIEADEQPMSLEPVRVEGVIREAVDIVRPLASTRGIWVAEVPHPSAQGYVRADRQRLTQVLLNLLSNAVKYNRTGGAVRIGCEPVQDAAGRTRLRIRVQDEGQGIPKEHQGQLFVPFARLGAEHTGVEGTGLGLALSQRLARAMGGALFLERSGPEGSVFAVDLEPAESPLAALPIAPVRADAAAHGAHGTATLLYVEDNLANLSLVETILLPRPEWRVLPALQGRMGLELAVQHAPDVILLDLHLPDMHGRDVLRQLRADPRTAEIPVVVISADATPKTIDTLAADGVEAFLTKPLDVRAFLATVDRLLARPRRARA
jgi:PAS domain S-box-containing protein